MSDRDEIEAAMEVERIDERSGVSAAIVAIIISRLDAVLDVALSEDLAPDEPLKPALIEAIRADQTLLDLFEYQLYALQMLEHGREAKHRVSTATIVSIRPESET